MDIDQVRGFWSREQVTESEDDHPSKSVHPQFY